MPEGDAVRRTAQRLDRALAGATLTATDFRVPQLATADLAGAPVHGTATYGKHLLTRVGDQTLHTHLRMEGTWRTHRPGARWERPAHEARVVLRTDTVEAVGFALGVVELVPSLAEHTITAHLGPDLLGEATWQPEEAVRRLLSDPARALGEALLDQTVVAGLGTIYVAEACFVHGVHPLTPAGQVPDPSRLLGRARRMLQLGVSDGRPITTGDRREPLWVYRRQRRPCRRCGTPISSGALRAGHEALGERTTYWCASCQPLHGVG